MQNDIENYLTAQKKKLKNDKVRLTATENDDEKQECKENDEFIATERQNTNNSLKLETINSDHSKINLPTDYLINDNGNSEDLPSSLLVDPYKFYKSVVKNRSVTINNGNNKTPVIGENPEDTLKGTSTLTKADKNVANENRLDKKQSIRIAGKSKVKDDKDEWISDVFYSHFPSFNNEKKRNENLTPNDDRQLNHQNYLKLINNEQQSQPPISPPSLSSPLKMRNSKTSQHSNYHHHNPTSTSFTSNKLSDNNTTHSNRFSSRSDKTEIEIIVNNPDFKLTNNSSNINNNKMKFRPSSTRDKLLQDLKHTEISNMVYSNAIQERNQQIAEREAQKKKEYQKELMRQIEEKRHEIQILKEKEKREEELLSRKLEQQLYAMQLEKELESEKLKLEKIQRETNHNPSNYSFPIPERRQIRSENDHKLHHDNKVYKYFSNSARYDNYGGANKVASENRKYNSSQTQQQQQHFFDDTIESINSNYLDDGNLSLQSPASTSFSIINRNLCPFCCNVKLKRNNYDILNNDQGNNKTTLCFNCYGQQQLQQQYQQQLQHESQHQQIRLNNDGDDDDNDDNDNYRHLICEHMKLNKFLNNIICYDCERRNTCNYCHHKRNLCNNCILNYCISCGKPIRYPLSSIVAPISSVPMVAAITTAVTTTTTATARSSNSSSRTGPSTNITTTPNTIASNNAKFKEYSRKNKNSQQLNSPITMSNEKSFQILEISYPEDDQDDDDLNENENTNNNYQQQRSENNSIHSNKLMKNRKSINDEIELIKKPWIIDDNDESFSKIKTKTNNQLTKYLNNYGDLALLNANNNRIRSNSMGSNRSRKTISTQTSIASTPRIQQQQEQQHQKDYKQEKIPKFDVHSISMPLLKDFSNKKSTKSNNASNRNDGTQNEPLNNGQILMASGKWEVSGVQKQKVSNESSKFGAIKKQLQVEKINLK